MSVADTLEFDPERLRPQGQADTRPAPGFLETAAAGFRYARDDQTGHTDEERRTAYAPVVTALQERGNDPRRYFNPYGAEPVNYDAVWRDVDAARRKDPEAFKEIGDRAQFEAGWRSSFAQRQAVDASTMDRGGWGGALAGGLVGSLTDPINVGGMVLTGGLGGTSVAGRMLAEAAINTGIEAIETPLTMAERKTQGRELTAEEIAMNLGFAAAGGAAFKGVEIAAPKLGAKAWEQVPWETRAALAVRRAKPDFALTPDEAAALHVVARGTEIDATNPFSRTYEGLEAHAARVDEMVATMSRWPVAAATPALAPVRRPATIGGDGARGITPDFQSAWRAVIGIEGGTNRDGSFRTSPAGAIGPAQVMPGTAPEAARLAGIPFDERRYRTDAAYNEQLGQAYYREMLRQFDGDPVKAAAAYNAGPGSTKRGTGVRGAMARAQRAGVPDEWVSFLPSETRAYVQNFRRRTGMEAGTAIDVGDVDAVMPVRPAALDAERPLVDMPELGREQFRSDAEHRRAQGEVDAEIFGTDPAAARHAVWIEARDQLVTDRGGEVPGALWHPELGSIDVKWGNDKGGLGKILEKHPEVLEDLPALLETMGIKSRSENRVVLQSLDHKAVVRLDYDGQAQSWLLSAYQVKGKAPPSTVYRGVDGGAQDRSPALGAASDIGDGGRGGKTASSAARNPNLTPRERVQAMFDEAPDLRAAFETHSPGQHPLSPQGMMFAEGWRAADGGVSRSATHAPAARAGWDAATARASDPVPVAPSVRDEMEADGGAGPAVVDVDAGKVFDEPGGDAVARVADLAWHDAQMAAAARKAPEQLTFDLGDGRGERAIADIEADLKADEDAISTIESCLAPLPAGGAL